VFIEDIDLIGQNRQELGYRSGPALLSLLAVLDGIEEKKEIVTVATTNCMDILDKAIKHRPSRFDRVIKLSFPSLEQRKELISLLSQKIPVDGATQDYIARQADNCTPAQLQEIIYSLVIEHSDEWASRLSIPLEFSRDDIDSIISKVNGNNGHRLGFDVGGNHNGEYGKAIYIEK
jgi:transitional endoplasmic reticulum ATPase